MASLVELVINNFKAYPFSEWKCSKKNVFGEWNLYLFSHEDVEYEITYDPTQNTAWLSDFESSEFTSFAQSQRLARFIIKSLLDGIDDEERGKMIAQMDSAASIFPNVDLSSHEGVLIDYFGAELFPLNRNPTEVKLIKEFNAGVRIETFKGEGQLESLQKLTSGLLFAYEESKKDEAAQYMVRGSEELNPENLTIENLLKVAGKI